jgi:NarL family two-component system sensor histidine kinase LiaS
MLAGMTKRFSSIRWKLTGAFLAVSMLLALTMAALLLGAMLYFLNAPLIPQALGDSAREVARGVSQELANPGGSPGQLFEVLRRFESASPGQGATQNDGLLVALLDTQGRVVTSTRALNLPIGVSLGAIEPEPAGELVVRALGGITETAQLAAWTVSDHQPIAVAPVIDSDGSVAGAVYLRLVDFPSIGILIGNLSPILVTFIFPWLLVSLGLGMLYAWLVGRGFAKRIARLTEASIDLSDGDLSRRIDDDSADELGQLGRQFNTMADQLSSSLRSLRLLADRNAQLAEQAAQLAAVEERNRLARELHDSVSQELFSLTMLAAAARRSIDTRPDLATARLAEIEQSARRALEETRSLIFALRPAALDGRGLAPALRDLVAALGERQGLKVALHIAGERRVPLEHEQALYRIVQEGLANIARHSGVREAEVDLRYDDDAVALTIGDGGRGFDTRDLRNVRGIGLQSMAERAEALGGSFAVESAPGKGTLIAVRIPVSEPVARPI